MSISAPGSRNAIERGVRPQDDAQELLAEITAPGSGAKPRLLFSRRPPASNWDRFVGWLTRPIQRIQAKARINEVLKELGLEKLHSEKSTQVCRLTSELANAGVFGRISMKTVRDAFIDLMINGAKPTGELDTLFKQHLDQVQHHYEGKITDFLKIIDGPAPGPAVKRADAMKGLRVLIEFARNPECSLSISENDKAREFIENFTDTGIHDDQLQAIFQRYSSTLKNQQELGSASRIVELNDHAPLTPLQQKTINDALDILQALFRPAEHASIAAFRQFIAGDIDLKIRENRQSLHEFLERFALKYLKLDRETQNLLRPLVIEVEDALLVAQAKPLAGKPQSSTRHKGDDGMWPEIFHPDWQALVDEFASNTGTNSKFSPACSMALIEYLMIRDRIHVLENENRLNDKKLASVKANVKMTLGLNK